MGQGLLITQRFGVELAPHASESHAPTGPTGQQGVDPQWLFRHAGETRVSHVALGLVCIFLRLHVSVMLTSPHLEHEPD